MINSSILVFREGLETILVFAAVTASFRGANTAYKRPVVLGGALGLLATVGTWFAVGSLYTAAVGVLTFSLHQKLPYKRLLIVTGGMLLLVLVVTVGEEVNEMQLAGWIGTTPLGHWPGWLGAWFSVFPNLQTVAAQLGAVTVVIGSYLLAEYLRVGRPRRRGLPH